MGLHDVSAVRNLIGQAETGVGALKTLDRQVACGGFSPGGTWYRFSFQLVSVEAVRFVCLRAAPPN